MRWNKRFDGTKASLVGKSQHPERPHPNAHTEQELKWIRDYHRRAPSTTVCELYGKLRTEKDYSRHPRSLYQIFVHLGYRQTVSSTKKAYKPKPYNTPAKLGVKWQMDVKYVPKACYTSFMPDKFYQYTLIDEAPIERSSIPTESIAAYTTVDFLKRAIDYFGYYPQILQTYNSAEFCYSNHRNAKGTHPLDLTCNGLGIGHKRIRPHTPRHNGKVELSYRNDQKRFYNHLFFTATPTSYSK